MRQSLFITFEGPEGGGKTTQVGLLKTKLERHGCEVVATREPGGTPFGENIRKVLKSTTGEDAPTPVAELLLFEAARAQHVNRVIGPALSAGKIVICDRYADSTMAYQGYARKLDIDMGNGVAGYNCITALNTVGTCGLYPDLTFVLDLDPEVGLGRRAKEENRVFDRFDAENLEFHRSVREAFLDMAFRNRKRMFIVDAARPKDDVANEIWGVVQRNLDDPRAIRLEK